MIGLISRKRAAEWQAALGDARRAGGIPWRKLLLAALSGPVPQNEWRTRIRTCSKCIIYDPEKQICMSRLKRYASIGCKCYIPFLTLSASPYRGQFVSGCPGFAATDGAIGWPAYRWPSRWARFKAVLYFLRNKRY